MKNLFFVRHGQSEANVAGVWSGHHETPLTDLGREQAKAAGISAKTLGIDHIICSPLGRTLDTAKIIAKQIGYPVSKIEKNSLFIERYFGAMEGQPWELDTNADGFVDVETVDVILERAKLALEHLRALEYESVLVVSHGTFGRALRSLIHPHMPFGPGDPTTRFQNAEIVKLI